MPKKNKTACKRRKYQRCRGSRNQKNNNRRTRTIRRGGLPPDVPDVDYESFIDGTYSDPKISNLLTELTSAIAELMKYDYMMPPGYQDWINSSLQRYKSSTIEKFTPEVRESIVRTIAAIKELNASYKESVAEVLSDFIYLDYLNKRLIDEDNEDGIFHKTAKRWEKKLQEMPGSERILKKHQSQ